MWIRDSLVVADEVVLEAVDHVLGLDEYLPIDAAVHQEALGLSLIHISPAHAHAQQVAEAQPPHGHAEDGHDHGKFHVVGGAQGVGPVSYTHLDVYKRQVLSFRLSPFCSGQAALIAVLGVKKAGIPLRHRHS